MTNIVIVCLFFSLWYNDIALSFFLGFAILMAIFYIRYFFRCCILLKATTSIYCTQYINGRSNFKWTTLKTGAVFAPFCCLVKHWQTDLFRQLWFSITDFIWYILQSFCYTYRSAISSLLHFFTFCRLGFFLLLNFNFRDFYFCSLNEKHQKITTK